MEHAYRLGLSHDQLESIKQLWDCVAALPENHMKSYLRELREVAMLLEIDSETFYEDTGGYYLYTDSKDYDWMTLEDTYDA